MQPLQKTVLNNITLGKTPLFIIAPETIDGGPTAALLSNNYRIKDMLEFSNSIAGYEHNYFNNSELSRVLQGFRDKGFKKTEESKATLRFLMEIGFDNNKLWGLLCSYEAFFELQLQTLFPNSFFAFIYNENTAGNIHLPNIIDFIKKNETNAFTIHSNSALYLPDILLRTLPVINVSLNIKDTVPQLRNAINNKQEKHPKLIETWKKLNESNLLFLNNSWYQGDDILYILCVSSGNVSLTEKIIQLQDSFLTLPSIHILCSGMFEIDEIKKNVEENFSGLNLNISHNNDLAIEINKIITNSKCDHIIIDNIKYTFSLKDILTPFIASDAPEFAFTSIISSKNEHIALPDLLLKVMNVDNLTFKRSAHATIGGFDTTLTINEMLWDFGVKVLKSTNGYGLAVKAIVNTNNTKNDSKTLITLQDNVYPANFDKLTEKYKTSFTENIKYILLNIFNNQIFLEKQIGEFDSKISNQQLLINQSRDEVKSLAELNVSMQQRLQILENKWHYKLSLKLKHFKGIFFKKSTSGTSTFKKIVKFIIFTFSKPGFKIFRKIIKGAFKRLYLITEDRPVNIIYLDTSSGNFVQQDYNTLIRQKLDPGKLRAHYTSTIDTLKFKPKISVIMPVYNPPLHFLRDAIESVINQSYTNWELCIADDCSPNPQIQRLLKSYEIKEPRIKVELREENGHISACTNSALALTTGDYVLLLDHDDTLTSNCIFEVVKHINAHPDDELIYSDEDKMLDEHTFIDPFFKPDWSPDKLMATNYISHVVTIKKTLIDEVGGFRLGFEGSQDYDLMLRCTERAKHVGHIAKILYHWRIHEMSVAGNTDVKPYAYIAGKKALEAALVRRNLPGEVQYTPERGRYRIKYQIRNYSKVSIIIPTKDAVSMMKNTIDSILSLTEYPNYEIIVLNNNSTSKEFFELMKGYSEKHSDKFRCVNAPFPFNFSKLMNMGASLSTGEYILMLNNDVEILKGDWITWMVAYTQNETTGAVGVKLLYPDDRIQHAGTVIGLGDDKVAAHAFVGYHKDTPGYFNRLQFVSNYAAVTAACLMVRKSVYDEVGGMDELLEVEYNDVDFCLKLVDKGYFNVYLPEVVLYHYESATRGHPHQDKKSYERHTREINYFKNKWKKYINHDPFYNPNLSLEREGFSVNYNNYD